MMASTPPLLLTIALSFLCYLLTSQCLSFSFAVVEAADPRPNVIVILADDVGWGDVGAYGSPSIKTPVLDGMIREGLKFNYLYTAQPICTPARGAMLSGRQPVRVGMYQNIQQANGSSCQDAPGQSSVLWWNSVGGLQNDTLLLPQMMSRGGYHTALVGKWHVGIGRHYEYLPMQKGFNEFYGTPLWHMTDMGDEKEAPDVPLMEGNKILGRLYKDIDTSELTQMYLARVLSIIDAHKSDPFFIYYAPDGTHEPTYASKAFQNTSARGVYGDAMQEMDWSIGQILNKLKDLNLDKNTLVFWSSDNGPALYTRSIPTMWSKLQAGSAGPLKGGKGTTWEGGIRMPGVAYWPGRIEPNRVSYEPCSLLDIMPTLLELANVSLPNGYVLDGVSMTNILFNSSSKSRHEFLYHWRGDTLYAVTYGHYKAHFWTQGDQMYTIPEMQQHNPPLIFNVMNDVSEQFPLAGPQDDPQYATVLAAVSQAYQREIASMVKAKPQFNICDDAAGMWSPDLPTPPSNVTCCVGGGN